MQETADYESKGWRLVDAEALHWRSPMFARTTTARRLRATPLCASPARFTTSLPATSPAAAAARAAGAAGAAVETAGPRGSFGPPEPLAATATPRMCADGFEVRRGAVARAACAALRAEVLVEAEALRWRPALGGWLAGWLDGWTGGGRPIRAPRCRQHVALPLSPAVESALRQAASALGGAPARAGLSRAAELVVCHFTLTFAVAVALTLTLTLSLSLSLALALTTTLALALSLSLSPTPLLSRSS